MKTLREYIDLIDSKQSVAESHSAFPEEHSKPMVQMMRYDGLDNSNPYHMWRFLVAVAGQPEPVGELSIEAPVGNKMASLAYTEADAEILRAGAAAMGEVGTEISSQESTEPSFVQKTSPIVGFKGYPR